MGKVFLLIGGNIGDRSANLQKAASLIQQSIGVLVAFSKIYETAAWGIKNQPPFLNQVIQIDTSLEPQDMLSKILSIEEMMGRTRSIKFGSRTIDIDILFFNNSVIYSKDLIIPHPEIQNRRFVLVPLHEIAANFIHPALNKTIGELLSICDDDLEVAVYNDR